MLGYGVHWITLYFLVSQSENKRRILVVNALVQFSYSAILIYNLLYNAQDSMGLVWLLYLIWVIGVHWLVNSILLIFRVWKKNKSFTAN